MKASDYYDKDFQVLLKVIKKGDRHEVEKFFRDNYDLEYNDFLVKLNQKYGEVVKVSKQRKTAEGVNMIAIASKLTIISFIIASCWVLGTLVSM